MWRPLDLFSPLKRTKALWHGSSFVNSEFQMSQFSLQKIVSLNFENGVLGRSYRGLSKDMRSV